MNRKRTLGIITALSIAMLAATIVVSYGVVLQAEATTHTWCYASFICFSNHGDCNKQAKADPAGTGTFKCTKVD